MVEPRVIPRDAHTLSRRDVDPDALKVLYRLRQSDYVAYLVGGSVRGAGAIRWARDGFGRSPGAGAPRRERRCRSDRNRRSTSA